MPETFSAFKALIACPSDCDALRPLVRNVIEQINNELEDERILVRYLGWDNTIVPGRSDRAQSVINDQVGDKYDLLIGILWTRLGTPTGKYRSGTEEEIAAAVSRHNLDGIPEILIYCNQTPLSPLEVDPIQLGQVQQFIKSLQGNGILTSSFSSETDFERLLRVHIVKAVRKLAKPDLEREDRKITPSAAIALVPPADTPGLLDDAIAAEDGMNAASQSLARLVSFIDELNTATERTTVQAKNAALGGTVDARLGKQLVDAYAGDLDSFSSRTRNELYLMEQQFSSALDAFARILTTPESIQTPSNKSQLQEAKSQLASLFTNLNNSKGSIIGFRDTIMQSPPLTSRLRNARNQAVFSLDQTLLVFDNLARSCNSVLNLFPQD